MQYTQQPRARPEAAFFMPGIAAQYRPRSGDLFNRRGGILTWLCRARKWLVRASAVSVYASQRAASFFGIIFNCVF